MEKLHLEPLSTILNRVVEISYGKIYLEGKYPWNVDTLGVIHETTRYGEPKFEEIYADDLVRYKLQRVLDVNIAKEIIFNGTRQKDDLSIEELVDCFNHYYAYDGFLDLLSR